MTAHFLATHLPVRHQNPSYYASRRFRLPQRTQRRHCVGKQCSLSTDILTYAERGSDAGPSSAKRPSKGSSSSSAASDAKEHARKLIKSAYRRYKLLSDAEGPDRERAYEALLEGCEGDPVVRRLAARLIPRFASGFPDKIDATARALMDLAAWDGGNLHHSKLSTAENARLDAIHGLGEICVAAAAKSLDNKSASSIIVHLFRRSQQSKGHKGRSLQIWATPSSAAKELSQIQETLRTILLGAPKTVLSACLEFVKHGSGELCEAAKEALSMFLAGSGGSANGSANAESHDLLPGETLIEKAVRQNARLAGWLSSSLMSSRAKPRDAEVAALLSGLGSAVSASKPSRNPSNSSLADALTETQQNAKQPEKGPNGLEAARKLEERPRQASRPPAPRPAEKGRGRGSPLRIASRIASAASGRVLENGNAMRRIESGELQEEALADGGVPDFQPERQAPGNAGREPGFAPRDPAFAPRDPLARIPRPVRASAVVFACLWVGGIASNSVTEQRLLRHCEDFAPVKRVMMLKPHARDQALIFFHEMRHAIACHEGLSGEVRFAGKPLDVHFCEDAPAIAESPECPPRMHVWVALSDRSDAKRDAILQNLSLSSVPPPKVVTSVGGVIPGLILEFDTPGAASSAAEALAARRQSPPVSGQLNRLSPLPRGRLSPPPFRGRSSPPSARGRFSPRAQRPRPDSRNRSPPQRPRSGSRGASSPRPAWSDLPDFASSTLWIGQVGEDIDEGELIRAFRRFGTVTGYKLLRKSYCGFIDFERVEEAAAARESLHLATFGSSEIKVEYKEEGRAMKALGRGFASRGGGRFGRGRGRFEPPPRRSSFTNSPPHRSFRGRGSPSYHRSPPNERGRGSRSPRRVRSPQFRRASGSRDRSPVPRGRQKGVRRGWDSPPRRLADSSAPAAPLQPSNEVGSPPNDLPQIAKLEHALQPAAEGLPPLPSGGDSASMEISPVHAANRKSGLPPLPGAPSRPLPSPAGDTGRLPEADLAPSPDVPSEQNAANARSGVLKSSPLWVGSLAKSGMTICGLECFEGPREDANGANGLEPLGWPASLNVTLRSDINGVLRNLNSLENDVVAVRRLTLASQSQNDARERFREFCAYLTGRNRAGVVESIAAVGGLLKRMMYLIPASEAAARGLNISWKPEDFMIFALVVPSTAQ